MKRQIAAPNQTAETIPIDTFEIFWVPRCTCSQFKFEKHKHKKYKPHQK